jgi:hypothetical protein
LQSGGKRLFEPGASCRVGGQVVTSSSTEIMASTVKGRPMLKSIVVIFTLAGLLAACSPSQQGPKGEQGPRDPRVIRGHQAHPAPRVQKASKGRLAHREQKASKGHRVRKASRVIRVPLAQLARLEHRVRRATKVIRESRRGLVSRAQAMPVHGVYTLSDKITARVRRTAA